MIRFNYLHDATPDAIERLRAVRVPPYLMTPVYVAVTSTVVLLAIVLLLHYRLDVAQDEVHTAQHRFADTRIALSNAKLERTNIDLLLALDRRLRDVRESGSIASAHLADIANHMPRRAWLSGISKAADGIVIDGEAEGLAGLGDAVEGLISSRTLTHPRLVRAAIEDRSHGIGVLAFEVHMEVRPR